MKLISRPDTLRPFRDAHGQVLYQGGEKHTMQDIIDQMREPINETLQPVLREIHRYILLAPKRR